ncbi:MAG: hypothetical protein COY66_06540 [Candidatus Kerfeldbacteria bacterium CG_4_10_14_0_8_um_filter_42_10]|uniref:HAMP domain-containing protein n=1 Tax=Candidatus Kerfeldbacteria bacterium CG_4_10_14_0_8_um_filter_42_10 TaxID=2014248 RepID=A0A2M7RFL5_9BACT|nr:MAG: hypothetical protein COY66_06540 [Candidatus Kerfeldbacteria bacterium CG_4_10_14_0_8_um_filter_42_10]
MSEYDYNLKPYQKHVFWLVFLALFINVIIFSSVIYFVRSQSLMNDYKEKLKGIAISVTKNISAEAHENIKTINQQDIPEYLEIESYFQTIIIGNPEIDDIYTLRPTNDPNIMTFVVAGQESGDRNNDNFIDESELRPDIGEEYDVSDLPELKNGLLGPSADQSFTTDKWGTWLSGYAPIRDKNGNSVALVGIDYPAESIIHTLNTELIMILAATAALCLVSLLVAYILSKVLSRPLKIMADGLRRLSHGDFSHQLPLKKSKSERMFVDLFNKVANMFENELEHEKKMHNNEE